MRVNSQVKFRFLPVLSESGTKKMKTLLTIFPADANINSDTTAVNQAVKSSSFVSTGGIDPIIRGVIGSPAPMPSADKVMSKELTDRLMVLNVPQHMDLAALNLQRGRDHALPGQCRRRERTNIRLNLASRIQSSFRSSLVVTNNQLCFQTWR